MYRKVVGVTLTKMDTVDALEKIYNVEAYFLESII